MGEDMNAITAIMEWLDVVGQAAGGGGTINWEAVEAVGVLIGASFVFWQVRHINADLERIRAEQEEMRVEQTHKKWEALQWAMSLLDREDFNEVLNPSLKKGAEELLQRWNLVALAAEQKYLDSDLLFQAFGTELAGTYEKLVEKEEKEKVGPQCLDKLGQPEWAPARKMLKDAYEWRLKPQSR
jgi:hypothetical protein